MSIQTFFSEREGVIQFQRQWMSISQSGLRNPNQEGMTENWQESRVGFALLNEKRAESILAWISANGQSGRLDHVWFTPAPPQSEWRKAHLWWKIGFIIGFDCQIKCPHQQASCSGVFFCRKWSMNDQFFSGLIKYSLGSGPWIKHKGLLSRDSCLAWEKWNLNKVKWNWLQE